MRIIFNKYIPFKGFIALLFYNILFWRNEYKYLTEDRNYFLRVYNHEYIHIEQMKDFCKFIPIGGTMFYIVYVFEWLFRVLATKDAFSKNAYKNISFEKEAKQNECNTNYLRDRKRFAQWKTPKDNR